MEKREKTKKKETRREKVAEKKFDVNLLLDNSPSANFEYYNDEAEILTHKIKTNGVNNIAVVASFGAGKSSAIETYIEKRREDERSIIKRKWYKFFSKEKKIDTFTRISLGSFNGVKYDDSDIERSILQQLFYSQPSRKLPNSKIERATATSKKLTFLLSLLLTLFVGTTVLFGLQVGEVFLPDQDWLNWMLLGIAIASFFGLVWFMLKFRKLQKIKYKDFELELKNEKGEPIKSTSGQSLINRFVDEVLYFFESIKIDLVIFEDLDRLADKNSSKIFVKLRELNTIINNSHQRKKKVTFLYAVKDSMLKKQEERAKFFEFILPIVPALNPVTKANKMHEENDRIKKKDEDLKLDPEFVAAVSSYVPNMRTLKNAFNDYLITRDRIFRESKKGRLHNENLFAICLYKNLYPDDHSKLEQGGGLIPIVMNKSHLISDEVKASKAEIKKWQDIIKKSKQEHVDNFEELKVLFESKLINGALTKRNEKQVVALDSIRTFQKLDFGTIYHRPSYQNYSDAMVMVKTEELWNTFVEREKIVLAKTAVEKERIAKLIEDEKQNIAKYETMTLGELVKEKGVDRHFKAVEEKETTKLYLAELKNMEIDTLEDDSKQLGYLRFLIQNDYIDENYMEYTSSYKSTMLSSADENFINKVKQGEQSFNANVDNIESVLDQLRTANFAEHAILNNTVLANLKFLKSQRNKNDKYKNIKNLLLNEQSDESVRTFIQSNDEDKVQEFLEEIVSDVITCERLLKGELAKDKKALVLLALIENMDDYKGHNINGSLSAYINDVEEYEKLLSKVDFVRAKEFLTHIKPAISTLGDPDNEITRFIIENNLYKITIENLSKVLGVVDEKSGFHKNNYAFISQNVKTKELIDNNPNEYIKNVFTKVQNAEENIEVAVGYLNNDKVCTLSKTLIIKKYDLKVDTLDDFDDDIHMALIANNRVRSTWKNILRAWHTNSGFNEIIKNFMLANADSIEGSFTFSIESKKEDVKEGTTEEYANKVIADLINAEYKKEELQSLKVVATKMDRIYIPSTNFINDDSFAIFIAEGKISYENNALKTLLEKPNALWQYITKYKTEVLENFNNFFNEVTPQALGVLLTYKEVDKELRQKLIIEHGDKVVIVGSEREYFNRIKEDNLKLPTMMLIKFKESILHKDEKLVLATWVVDWEQNNHLFCDYLRDIMPELKSIDKEIKIEIENDIHERLLRQYAVATGMNFSKRKNKVTLKFS